MARVSIVSSRVFPHSPVKAHDLAAGLLLGGPQVGADRGLVIPPGQQFGKRFVEDLAEIPRLPERRVLDQPEKVGPSDG
jgi:hypothetical protein